MQQYYYTIQSVTRSLPAQNEIGCKSPWGKILLKKEEQQSPAPVIFLGKMSSDQT
jgi:hypothetical protein